MRAVTTFLLALSACWVAPVAYVDEPTANWCISAPVPDARCEEHYVWVRQDYWYHGAWYGGHYVIRPNVIIRDHRRRR